MTLLHTLHTAARGITGNKLRAALTTLGIIIGVASVIAMLALGNGARAAVEANFRDLGADIILIGVERKADEEQGELVPVGKILTYQDGLYMPAEVELVRRVERFWFIACLSPGCRIDELQPVSSTPLIPSARGKYAVLPSTWNLLAISDLFETNSRR